jgi:hypothetical protein
MSRVRRRSLSAPSTCSALTISATRRSIAAKASKSISAGGRCGCGRGLAGCEVFQRSVGDRLDLERIDASHQRLERVQGVFDEQGAVIVPGQRFHIEESLGLGGEHRQHRLEEDHQLAEQVDPQRTDSLDFVLAAFQLGQ